MGEHLPEARPAGQSTLERSPVSLFTADARGDEIDDAHDPVVADARLRGRRVGWLLLALTLFGVFGLAVLPTPYVIERPGPVFDTLGSVTVGDEEVPLIEIPSAPTFETEGSLSLSPPRSPTHSPRCSTSRCRKSSRSWSPTPAR